MTRNEAKRNAILGVFCPKRNMTFFSVSLSKLGTDRNGAERSGTLILDLSWASHAPFDVTFFSSITAGETVDETLDGSCWLKHTFRCSKATTSAL